MNVTPKPVIWPRHILQVFEDLNELLKDLDIEKITESTIKRQTIKIAMVLGNSRVVMLTLTSWGNTDGHRNEMTKWNGVRDGVHTMMVRAVCCDETSYNRFLTDLWLDIKELSTF